MTGRVQPYFTLTIPRPVPPALLLTRPRAVIKEFWATGGRRVLWVSTSNDLRYDARRDLADLGVGEDAIPVYPPVRAVAACGACGGGVVWGLVVWCRSRRGI
jgi:hypothetical protein